MNLSGKDIERFWSKVDKSGECWTWTAAHTAKGYGKYAIGMGKWALAHRVAYTITQGVIPDDMLVCHTCDNRECVRPSHLFLGTPLDNTQDMDRKGRRSVPPRERENNGNARLTQEQVNELRRLAGHVTHAELARRFGIGRTQVRRICRGENW